MPSITFFHNIKSTRLLCSCALNHHLDEAGREVGLVVGPNHVCRRNIAPCSVRGGTEKDAGALMFELCSPFITFFRAEVVVEDPSCILRSYIYDTFLCRPISGKWSNNQPAQALTSRSTLIQSGNGASFVAGWEPSGIAYAMMYTSLSTPPLRPIFSRSVLPSPNGASVPGTPE